MVLKIVLLVLAGVLGIGGFLYLVLPVEEPEEKTPKLPVQITGFPAAGEQRQPTSAPTEGGVPFWEEQKNEATGGSKDGNIVPEIKIINLPSIGTVPREITQIPKKIEPVVSSIPSQSKISSFLESFKRIFSPDFGSVEPSESVEEVPYRDPSVENGFYSPTLKKYYNDLVAAKLIKPGEFSELKTNSQTEAFFIKILDYEFTKGNMSTSTLEAKKKFLRDTYAAIANRTFGR